MSPISKEAPAVSTLERLPRTMNKDGMQGERISRARRDQMRRTGKEAAERDSAPGGPCERRRL